MTLKTPTPVSDLVTAALALESNQFDLLFSALMAVKSGRREDKARRIASTLIWGDKVQFDAKSRGVITGMIIKVNPKTAKVKQTHDQYGRELARPMTWNVSLTLIKKVD